MIEALNGAVPVTAPASTAKPGAEAKTEPAKLAQTVDTAPISPRLRFDAVSGVVVTEFLNGKNVQSQTPTAAALAYLRVGLDADGRPKSEKA